MSTRDHHHPTERLDELASAYLDGEASADERSLVESDPALLARVQELRDVAALVGAAVEADHSQRSAHISRALEDSGTDASVSSLDRVRRRRPDPRVLAAAAVVLAALVAIPFLARNDSGDQTTAIGDATGVETSQDGSEAAATLAAPSDDTDAAVTTGRSSASAGAVAHSGATAIDLGEVADLGGLVSEVRAAIGVAAPGFAADAASETEGSAPPLDPGCASFGPHELQAVTAAGSAIVDGEPITFLVTDGLLVVVDEATCSVVSEIPLD